MCPDIFAENNQGLFEGGQVLLTFILSSEDIRLSAKSAKNASTAISIVQTFTNALRSIGIRLAKMEELAGKAALVEKLTVVVESEIKSAVGVKADKFTLKSTLEINSDTASRIIKNSSDALKSQANVEPSIALQLLKDNE
jgi:hypothetical protein